MFVCTRILLLTMLLAVLPSCMSPIRKPREAAANEPTFVVMSYNVNFATPGDSDTIAAIRNASPDAAFLQETTPGWEAAIRRGLSQTYPYMHFLTSPGAGGQAVLSKYPFTIAQQIPSPVGWFPALRILLQSPLGKVQVLAMHLHPQEMEDGNFVLGCLVTGPDRLKEIQTYFPSLDAALPTLALGDLNEDHAGKSVSFLYDRHLRDALREFLPNDSTWRWAAGHDILRVTLDHIFYSPHLEPLNCRVLHTGNSDHYPILATFIATPHP